MDKAKLLIIEDEDFQYEIYEDALSDYQLIRAKTASEALKSIQKDIPNLIILDHILSKGELGLDFLPQIKELVPFVPIIIVSGALEVHQQIQALQGPRRAHYCITKPVDVHELKQTIITALEECGEKEVISRFEALERSKRSDIEFLLSRSTDRLSRQNEILAQVKNIKGRPNVSALARQFRVARRTIIRDFQELIRRGQLPPEIFPKWEGYDEDENEE
jgi:DNA-binding NtrC family response regulator